MKVLKYSLLSIIVSALFLGAFSCDPDGGKVDDDIDMGDDGGDPQVTVQILVKRKSGDNTLNNYTSLVVLGTYRDSMNRFEYKLATLGGGPKNKPVLQNYEALKESGNLLDTFYTRKGTADNPNTGKLSSAATMDIDEGKYFVHVLDAGLMKAVFEVEATEANKDDDLYIAELQELGKLKISARLGSTAGGNMDDVDVRLYGYTTDTLNAALTGRNPSEITVDHYYKATTATIRNENGNKEEGIAFLYDIPVRNYYVLGYSNGSNSDQAQHALTDMRKNQLSFALLAF